MGVNQKIGSYAVKPTKYAPHICTGVTIVALIGIIVGLLNGNALWPVILLLPAAFYEAYRTGGKSTKWLAVTIFITSFAIVYTIDPDIFSELFKYALNEGLNRM